MIFQMEKVKPSFEYEPLVLSLEPETLNEEQDKMNTDGAKPSCTSSKGAMKLQRMER
jgi:hypothetical protein